MLAEAAEEASAVGAPAEAASFWTAAADLLGRRRRRPRRTVSGPGRPSRRSRRHVGVVRLAVRLRPAAPAVGQSRAERLR